MHEFFVGGIHPQCTQEDFESCFNHLEGYKSALLTINKKTNTCKGYGYIKCTCYINTPIIYKGRELQIIECDDHFDKDEVLSTSRTLHINLSSSSRITYTDIINILSTKPDIINIDINISSDTYDITFIFPSHIAANHAMNRIYEIFKINFCCISQHTNNTSISLIEDIQHAYNKGFDAGTTYGYISACNVSRTLNK